MVVETITVEVKERGAKKVRRSLADIGGTSKKSGEAVNRLKGILAGLSAALVIREVFAYGQSWVRVNNSLRSALTATQSLSIAQKDVIAISRSARAPLEQVASLYAGISAASNELGVSQQEIATFTQLAAKAIAVQGSSAGEATGALLQLRQAIGGSVIQAQEFNSLIDGARPLLEAVANGSDRFAGSVNTLREEVRSGTVTSKEFFEAALKGSDIIEQRFAKTTTTAAQSLTVFRNRLTEAIGASTIMQSVSAGFSDTMLTLSDNLEIVGTAALVTSGAVIAGFIAPTIVSLAKLVIAQNAYTTAVSLSTIATKGFLATIAVLGGPLRVIGAIIGAITVAVVRMADQIRIPGTEFATLADVASVSFDRIKVFVSETGEFISSTFNTSIKLVQELIPDVGTTFRTVLDAITDSIVGIPRIFANMANAVVNLSFGISKAFGAAFEGLLTIVKNPLDSIIAIAVTSLNKLNAIVESVLNGLIRQANKVASIINASIPEIQIPKIELPDSINKDALDIGKNIADSFAQGLRSNVVNKALKGISDGVRSVLSEANERAKNRLQSPSASPERVEQVAKIEDAVGGGGNPVGGGGNADNTGVLLKRSDVLGEINIRLKQEAELLKILGSERQIQGRFMQVENALRRQGIALTGEEATALKEQLKNIESLRSRAEVLDRVNGSQLKLSETIKVYTQLLKDSSITQEQVSDQILKANESLFRNTQTGFESLAEQRRKDLDTINQLRDAELITEQTAAAARLRIRADEQKESLTIAAQFFGNLAALRGTESKKAAKIARAAAITQAVINTYLGATQAFTALSGILYVGPVLGGIAAAAAIASGLQNVQRISSARALGGEANKDQLLRVGENDRPEMFRGNSGQQFFIPPERGRIEPINPTNPNISGPPPATRNDVNNNNTVNIRVNADKNGYVRPESLRQIEDSTFRALRRSADRNR